ncbi:hypothetical protein GCM10023080_067010 [Streptomyces pseudoechinosporeus]
MLDNWDPRVIDGIAARHPVITFDNRGVGASEGRPADSIAAMARDAVAFIRALGFDEVDLLGFSMGGMVAQVIAQKEPQLVRKLILAGAGPAGGEEIDKVTRASLLDTMKAKDLQRPEGTPLPHPNRKRQVGCPTIREATERAYKKSRQGYFPHDNPSPVQGHPRLGDSGTFRLDERPAARPGGKRRRRQDGAHQ